MRKHHPILAHGLESEDMDLFSQAAATDPELQKIWDEVNKDKSFFMHINTNNDLSLEDSILLLKSLKTSYEYARAKNREDRQKRKAAKEALKSAKSNT